METGPLGPMNGDSGLHCLGCDAVASPACIGGGHALLGLEAHRRLLQQKEAVSALRRQAEAAMDKYQAEQPGSGHQLDQELQLINCQEPVAIVCDTWLAQSVQLQQQPALRIAMLLLLQQGLLKQQHEPPPHQQRQHHQQEQQGLQQQERLKMHQEHRQQHQEHQQHEEHHRQLQQQRDPPEKHNQLKQDEKKLQGLRQQQYQKLQELRQQKLQQKEQQLRAHLEQLDLYDLSQSPAQEWEEEKAQVLLRGPVHVLTGLQGQMDPAWVLRVLQRHAPSLQELQLRAASREHLLQLQQLPQLRRLEVQGCQQDVLAEPALPGPWRAAQLEWLLLADLPRQTLQDLVSALAGSLQELELFVGTPPEAGDEEDWPWSCADLRALLQRCGGLQRLRSLRLLRWLAHSRSLCAAQLAALRPALPGCRVSCSRCSS